MSDSSEDEDLSRFKEAVDTSFLKLIDESRGKLSEIQNEKPKSERYLEVASHYNDVKVPEELQKRIGAKISAILNRTIEFVNVEHNGIKKRKTKGGVKLFKNSEGFLSCEEVKDTYTQIHNSQSKKIKKKRREITNEYNGLTDNEKVNVVAVSGEFILSKEEIKLWKPRRKEKLFKYKSDGKSKILTTVD